MGHASNVPLSCNENSSNPVSLSSKLDIEVTNFFL